MQVIQYRLVLSGFRGQNLTAYVRKSKAQERRTLVHYILLECKSFVYIKLSAIRNSRKLSGLNNHLY